MAEPTLEHAAARSLAPRAPSDSVETTVVVEPNVPEQYELLLSQLANAERELETEGNVGRSGYLEEASAIVFDLLYSLDFKHGGEMVPRLAALYGYVANELLNVGRSGDRAQLSHIRDIITALRQSWYGAAA